MRGLLKAPYQNTSSPFDRRTRTSDVWSALIGYRSLDHSIAGTSCLEQQLFRKKRERIRFNPLEDPVGVIAFVLVVSGPSPTCLHDGGRFRRNVDDGRGRWEAVNINGIKPLSPKGARHHQLNENAFLGFDPRSPLHQQADRVFSRRRAQVQAFEMYRAS